MKKCDGKPPKKAEWCVYMLRKDIETNVVQVGQGNRALYVGMTNNFLKRFSEHNGGLSKATRGFNWIAYALLPVANRQEATAVEGWLKCGDTKTKRAFFREVCPFGEQMNSQGAQIFIKKAMLWKARQAWNSSMFKEVKDVIE